MKYLISEKISPHRYIDSAGYLICTDAILSRIGSQNYAKSEIYTDSDDDTLVPVYREKKDVFEPDALKSFENRTVTIEHPEEDVNPDNNAEYAVGFARDVHEGIAKDEKGNDQDVMLATLVITDQDTIDKIQAGDYKYLSCGYECDFVKEGDKIFQRHIRGNHIAICQHPRAGFTRIQDSLDTGKAKSETLDFKNEAMAISAKSYVDKFNIPAKVKDSSMTIYAPTIEKLGKLVDFVMSKFDCEKHKTTDSAYGQPIERNTVTIRRGYHNLSPSADKFKEVYLLAMKESSMINIRMLINCLESMYIDAYNDAKEAYQKDIASIAINKYSKALQLANDFKIKRKGQLNSEQLHSIDDYIKSIENLCAEIEKNSVPSTFKQELTSMIDKYNDNVETSTEESLEFDKNGKPVEEETELEEKEEEVPVEKKEEAPAEDVHDSFTVIADSPEEATRLVKLAIAHRRKKNGIN